MPDEPLSARGLKKRFGALWAVSDISLDVATGELHALIGPNGAGKSTLINLLSGDLHPTSGQILIEGRDVTALGPSRRALAGIGRSYQKTTIFTKATAFENARLAAQAHSRIATSLVGSVRIERSLSERAERALAAAGLWSRAGAPAYTLSHGEQRALEIAMVLATEPRVMLLDEPLAGMGQAESQAMVGLIASLKPGRGILLVEHDMHAVFALADRLTVMADGRIVASGTPAEVRAHPAVRTAYLGAEGEAPQ